VNHLAELQLRRRELVERSAVQRAALRASLAPMLEKTAVVDRAMASVRRYPMISTGLAAAVTLFGSRKLFTWFARGLTLYTLLRKI
jgi:hypothetical protein